MEGLSDVTRRIVRYHAGRSPELVQRKYALMAASPFSFYRGSCQLFLDGWPARAPLDRAPAVWGCGDLHFENLGSFKGDNRLVYFDLNDFDEAALVPATWELVRFVASVLIGACDIKAGVRDATALARCYLDAYASALAFGKARWVERDTAEGMVHDLLDAVQSRKRKKLLGRRTVQRRGRRTLRIDGVKALPASAGERARVRTLIESAGRRTDEPGFYRVLDVARRIAGTGSLGLARWVVLVAGEGSPDGNYLLDLKEARPSAPAPRSPFRQPRWPNEAARIVEVQHRVQAVSPALLRAVPAGARSFVLRELQPTQDRLRLRDWGGDLTRLRDAMTTMGHVTAWAALRASGRDGSATADELIAFAADRMWRRQTLALAQRVAARTLAEWRAFRADVEAKRV